MNEADPKPEGASELPPELVEIQSLDQFASMLVAWFEQRRNQMFHLTKVPEGSEFTVGDGPDARSVVLTGQVMTGFQFGVEMALMALGDLPFVAHTQEAQPPKDATH